MSFFIRNKQKTTNRLYKKKLRKNNTTKNFRSKFKKLNQDLEEEIVSDEIEDEEQHDNNDSSLSLKRKKNDESHDSEFEESENELETPQEKKIRLAKQYLAELEQSKGIEINDDEDSEGEDRFNHISAHLKDSVLEKAGRLHREVAERYQIGLSSEVIKLKNGHRKPITTAVVSSDGRFVFTASKDCNIIKWNLETGKRIRTAFGNHRQNPEKFKGHTGTINALALSSDGKFLASGCVNHLIQVWNPDNLSHLHTFRGHRNAIIGLVFRRSFHQLFSCSADRMIKVWSLDEMTYIESLFGHHDSITSIDSFVRERCLTAGGRDGSIRLWKIPEQSHLIYLTGGTSSVDCVRMVDESHFVSASDDGSISLWNIGKKKPIKTLSMAHGSNNWITSIASLKSTDLIASGSYNGKITFWKIQSEFKGLVRLFDYEVCGFVNALEFSCDGRFLVCALSQEHRSGRWWRLKEARNVVHIIPLKLNE